MSQLKSICFPVAVGLAVVFLAAPPERAAEAEAGQAVAGAVLAEASGAARAIQGAIAVLGAGAVALPWVTIVGVVAAVIYLVLLRRSQWVASHQAAIESAARTAFGIVENLKLTGQLTAGVNKAEIAIAEFRRIMARQNLPVNDQIEAAALDIFNVMHAGTKTAAATPAPKVSAP